MGGDGPGSHASVVCLLVRCQSISWISFREVGQQEVSRVVMQSRTARTLVKVLCQLLLQTTPSMHTRIVLPPFKRPVEIEGQSVGSCYSLVLGSMTSFVASVELPLILLRTADLPFDADEAPKRYLSVAHLTLQKLHGNIY